MFADLLSIFGLTIGSGGTTALLDVASGSRCCFGLHWPELFCGNKSLPLWPGLFERSLL